jgi:hypothetical protein
MQDLLEKVKEKYPTLTLSRFHLNRELLTIIILPWKLQELDTNQ